AKNHAEPAVNTIAFTADKEKKQYKLFANGELIATLATNDYKFINDITGVDHVGLGGVNRQGTVAYPFSGTVHDVKIYGNVLSDDELIKTTATTAHGKSIFYAGDATKSNYFRIPALLTLTSDTVVAAADARYGGTHDAKSNIDIAFSKSTDGGNTWSEPTMPLYFDDYISKQMDWPRDNVGKNVQIQGSATFIDPVLLEDDQNKRLFLFADAMPAGIGVSNASKGSGYKEINGEKYIKLRWHEDGTNNYHYTIREGGVIYDDTTNKPTEYSVNGQYELLKNGEPLTCKQYDYYFEGTNLREIKTDVDIKMNVFYKDSDFLIYPTNYLAMKYSDDEGATWSDLKIISSFKPENEKFLVVGPGVGKQISVGEYKGRLIVPLYSNVNVELGFMYSDDHGETWNYVAADQGGTGATAEAQTVEMPDGSLKTYMRTAKGTIAEVTSLDGGESWSDRKDVPGMQAASYGTQVSAINYSQLIDGKPAIILAAPNATNGRRNGVIHIGLIHETGKEGIDKYSIDWKYNYGVDGNQIGYSYSCLTELPNGDIGLLYEKYDSWSRDELHLKNVLKYDSFTIDELMEQ
ncbi:MAG TPA: exo-alpha-sialidase, partial [Candidatus Merdenecus merdavium]|nr:exo-alpha-sialidase [Candidatus Merdenecus merdavium]